jgi:signal recognition particle receptor subunit beta
MKESTEWLGLHVNGHRLPLWFGELKMKEDIPWLVVCNRDHETEVLPMEEMRRHMKLDELRIDYQVQPICIATGEGIGDGLKQMVERLGGPQFKKKPDMIELNNTQKKL